MTTDYQAWQNDRRAYLTSRTGNLALVAYQPVTSEDAVPIEQDFPATVALAPGQEGVFITAEADDNVTVDGQPLVGKTFVGRLTGAGTPIVSCGQLHFDVFSLDGSDYELRIYDETAETLDNFNGIEYYDEDPALVIEGTYRQHTSTDHVAWDFTRSSDTGHKKTVPGVIDITVDGKDYELMAFQDSDNLVLVYADGTTGEESYAPGRFLRMPLPAQGGAVTVDFNRTFIPPCGFSDFYSCPIPPPQNKIDAPIRGGEKVVTWKRPRY